MSTPGRLPLLARVCVEESEPDELDSEDEELEDEELELPAPASLLLPIFPADNPTREGEARTRKAAARPPASSTRR
jgi:hypothetical protein